MQCVWGKYHKLSYDCMTTTENGLVFSLFVWGFRPTREISLMWRPLPMKGCKSQHQWPLSSEGFLACTFTVKQDTVKFILVISDEP